MIDEPDDTADNDDDMGSEDTATDEDHPKRKEKEEHYLYHTPKHLLPSALKIQDMYTILDEALYEAHKEYQATYMEILLALHMLFFKIWHLYYTDIVRRYLGGIYADVDTDTGDSTSSSSRNNWDTFSCYK